MTMNGGMRLQISSAQLVQLGTHSMPTGSASCCLIDYRGKRILLTVSHATGNNGDWAIQLRYDPTQGTRLHRLGPMNFLAKASLDSPILTDVDFSYVQLPQDITAYRQDIDAQTHIIKAEVPITVHTPTLTETLGSDDTFGFCGMVHAALEEHFGNMYFTGDVRAYDDLAFVRTEGDYHVFKLPFTHPGHGYFKGCSGAPIVNCAGVPVALVCEGDMESDEIWGISLGAYKAAIDIMVESVGA